MELKIYRDSLYNGEHLRILVDTIQGNSIKIEDLFSAFEREAELMGNPHTVELDTDVCHEVWWRYNSIQQQRWIKHLNALAVKHESRGKLLMKLVYQQGEDIPAGRELYMGKIEIEK